MHTFHAKIVTLFPEMFPGALGYSLAGQALKKSIWTYETINLRDFGLTKHKNVDDTACGGGNGLIMRPDVVGNALDHALSDVAQDDRQVYYPSPRGKPWTQELAEKAILRNNIIILCGRFEGIDERVIEEYNATEISMGDFVLSGGELAALIMLDSIIRLLPGVLSNRNTTLEESFAQNGSSKRILEYPLYTKPERWRGRSVPSVLLSGNHQEIKKWKDEQSLRVTKERRPELLKKED